MKIRAIQWGLTAAALLTLTGCITGNDRSDSENPAYAETKLLAGEKAKYEAARKKWAAYDLSFYYFTASYDCFCWPSGEVQVRVRHNRVVGASTPDCDQALPVEALQELHTIDGLFDMIKAYLENPDYTVRVSYHYGLGYPTDMSFRHKDETLLDANVHIGVKEIQIPVAQ